jgi:serine/threonine protein kinase
MRLSFSAHRTLTTVGYYIVSQILIQILKGVNYLHKRNLIHRDLKPPNILLKKCYRKGLCAKIADFGIMVFHKCTGQSHTARQGQGHYMAKEVKEGKRYDTKADIYSVGVIFKELIGFTTDFFK